MEKQGAFWNKDQKSTRSNSALSAPSPADAAWEENDGAYIIDDPFLCRAHRMEYITRPDRANNRSRFCPRQSGLLAADRASGVEEIKARVAVRISGFDLRPLAQAERSAHLQPERETVQVIEACLRSSLFSLNSDSV